MTGPQDPAAGRDRLRAGHADRDQVIEKLKIAFVHGRLTKDELGTRAGQALASRTYAELAALTVDLPAGSAAAEHAVEPAGTPARTLAKAARRSAICLLIAFALVGVVALANKESLAPLAFFPGIALVIAASGSLGYGVVDAWQERRSRGQLPPRSTQRRRALEGEQSHGPSDGLILCLARSGARAAHLPGQRATQPARRSRTVRRARGRIAVLRVTA